ncbi:MAG: ExbD/TolR family protein [Thermovirgaceae bacterium]
MKKRYTTDIELTPLIDVLFMLIVFFVLTTSFAASSISVDLPSGTGGPVEGAVRVITVTRQGEVFYEEKRVTPSKVAAILAEEAKEKRILIRSDREAAYGNIVEVLDALGKAGLTNIDLAVEDVSVP